ncbi:toll/interleukin-1 receptor domain-containing protein [Starkeya koreensis]|uniref:Toll/interleukin-1 receptor domain-containing protein n=1 Tax=Ancylobacter koreensis TaxID=266121 RepID=A0ABT0DJG9_9HYPH|nr:toll/interleukin-1 receptor domain-containing protein [Ancylobacter koreensis]MCK0207432.1 toll/interleukin-1 receptor domain-containing protein [Ancylobacter koreensis]
MPDLFICYSAKDREQIRPIVAAYRRAGLDVWWDQCLEEGDWGPQIEAALKGARRVLAFITPYAVRSENHFIVAEIAQAHLAGKLIPVKVGEFEIPYIIQGYVFGKQMALVSDFEAFVRGPDFERVSSILSRVSGAAAAPEANPASELVDQYADPASLALALAVAVAENAPLAAITEIAEDLERRFTKLIAPAPTETGGQPFSAFLQSNARRLQGISAEIHYRKHRRYNTNVECVRFTDSERAAKLLERVWRELDGLRPTLIEWLDHLSHTASAPLRQRIALVLGVLARTPATFGSVYDGLFDRWIVHEGAAARELVDLALCFVVLDKRLEATISQRVREYARSQRPDRLRAAIELACGFTGSRIQGLPVEILKTVAQSRHKDFKVLKAMDDAITFMIASSGERDDASLLDWPRLINDLSDWARSPDQRTPQRLPMYLFLSLMGKMSLRSHPSVAGVLSLEALVEADAQSFERSVSVLEPTARVFEAALRDPGDEEFRPRDAALAILKDWIATKPTATAVDPLLTLLREIHAACPTTRDRDRLIYAVRSRYEREQISVGGRAPAPAIVERGVA